MKTIGLIGAENVHAKHFAEAINEKKLFDGFRVTGVLGDDSKEKADELSKAYGLEICGTLPEIIKSCDAFLITYRKGSAHYNAAMQVLEAGKPVLIDKPFTSDPGQAKEITDYAKKNNLLICGGSAFKELEALGNVRQKIVPGCTAVISFAADKNSEYEGYNFYGCHSVEICLALFGTQYKSVSAYTNGNTIISTIKYEDKQCIIINSPVLYDLNITVYGEKTADFFSVQKNYQTIHAGELVNMIKTGKPPREYDYYVSAVKLTNDIVTKLKLNE